ERALTFIVEATRDQQDMMVHLMRLRLALIRRCRTLGIDAAFEWERQQLDAFHKDIVPAEAPAESTGGLATSEELTRLSDSTGSVDSAQLRALVERRPEL